MQGAEGGGQALFTVTWLLVVPGRCSLQINPSRARQAPRPLPQPGGPSRGPGVAASPREASAPQPGPLPPSPRFLQAMVAAASLTRTQQPLLPTCRGALPAEHPASGLCHGLGLRHQCPLPLFLDWRAGSSSGLLAASCASLTRLSPGEAHPGSWGCAWGSGSKTGPKAPKREWEPVRG